MAATTEQLEILIKAHDEASKVINGVQKNVEGLGSKLAKVGAAVGVATLAAGAAVAAFAVSSLKDYSDIGDAVEKMAGRTGLAAESVSALRVAADMGGTSIDAVEAAVKKMQMSVTDLSAASPQLVYQLNAMGFSLRDIQSMSPDKQFEAIGNAIAMIEDPAQRTQMAIAAFGKAGTDLIPMFENGNFSMDAWVQQADKLGVKFDELSAQKAAALNDALGALNTAWTGMKMRIAGELAPAITSFINNQIVPFAEALIGALPSLSQVSTAIDNMKSKFSAAMADFEAKTGLISQVRDGFSQVWQALTEKLGPALVRLWEALQPLMPVLAELGRIIGAVIVVALKLLIDMIIAAINVFIDMTTATVNAAASIMAALEPAFKFMQDGFAAVGKAIQFVIDKYEAMRAAALSAFNAAKNAIGSVPGIGAVVSMLPGRASGGPVTAGQPYMVGERGPEMFVPRGSGTIIPNGASAMEVRIMEGATVSVRSDADIRSIADQVSQALARTLQSQRNGLAT